MCVLLQRVSKVTSGSFEHMYVYVYVCMHVRYLLARDPRQSMFSVCAFGLLIHAFMNVDICDASVFVDRHVRTHANAHTHTETAHEDDHLQHTHTHTTAYIHVYIHTHKPATETVYPTGEDA
jgi:hypothetical protein